MAKKIACPKCGKLCGPTYLDRHVLSCTGQPQPKGTIETKEAVGLNTTRANLISELLDIQEPELNESGEIDEGDDLDCDEEEEEIAQDGSGSSGVVVIGLILFAGVVIISIGAFIFKRSNDER